MPNTRQQGRSNAKSVVRARAVGERSEPTAEDATDAAARLADQSGRMTDEVAHQATESARASTQVAQAPFDQLAELNREALLAWTRGLEGTWRAALGLRRAQLDATRRILEATTEAGYVVAHQWVDMTAQVQQSLLEGQVRLVETVADRRRAALQRWPEAGGPAADGARAAVHTAALVEEGTAERLLEGTVEQVKAAIRPIDDPV